MGSSDPLFHLPSYPDMLKSLNIGLRLPKEAFDHSEQKNVRKTNAITHWKFNILGSV